MVVTLTDPSSNFRYVPNIFQSISVRLSIITNQYTSKPTVTSMNARKGTVRFLSMRLLQSLKTPGWDVWETGSADEICWIGRGGLRGKTLGLHLSLLGGRCQCHHSEDKGSSKFGNSTVDSVDAELYSMQSTVYYRILMFFTWFNMTISSKRFTARIPIGRHDFHFIRYVCNKHILCIINVI